MGKIIFLFFLSYYFAFAEKYIVIRIADNNSVNRSLSNLTPDWGLSAVSSPPFGLEGIYKSKSVSILFPPLPLSSPASLETFLGRGCPQHHSGEKRQRHSFLVGESQGLQQPPDQSNSPARPEGDELQPQPDYKNGLS